MFQALQEGSQSRPISILIKGVVLTKESLQEMETKVTNRQYVYLCTLLPSIHMFFLRLAVIYAINKTSLWKELTAKWMNAHHGYPELLKIAVVYTKK